jgi:hypothetical protein
MTMAQQDARDMRISLMRPVAHAVTDKTLLRLTECNEVTEIWRWTRLRMAIILRMVPRTFPRIGPPSEFSILATS